MSGEIPYSRILLKISGESLQGNEGFGIDPAAVDRITSDIVAALALGVSISIVVGGGNLFRGSNLASKGMTRVTGDHMGMLATVMNALALRGAIREAGKETVILSAIEIPKICDSFSHRALDQHIARDRMVIFAGGTGNPFFTTDTAAALRAAEIGADALFKGTQVDGVYSADPTKDPGAKRFDRITHSQILSMRLEVMDAAAVNIARDHRIPIVVFSIHKPGGLSKILQGKGFCTTVSD